MTMNDVGHWQRVNATSSDQIQTVPSDQLPTYVYQPVQPTEGIVLDQKVLVGLVLILGIVVGVSIILVLDKYHK
jgi:hypothetical protein